MKNGADLRYFSAPGRVEVGGNHTDHQRGRVLASAINLEASAAVTPNGTNVVRMKNAVYGSDEIDLSDLKFKSEEIGTPASLVRGVAAWFVENGYAIGGFDAEISSNIPLGAGLSSSAAIEVLIGNIFKGLFGADISRIEIAQAGQYAENIYFGKPCGLMDQAASSFGGLNLIDFHDPDKPIVTSVLAEFPGYSLCVVNTGGSHADLTPDYAACTREMKLIAKHFGKEFLRDVSEDEFFSSLASMRRLGDRALLRAIHFFGDNKRVLLQVDALEKGDMDTFLELVIESGRSSFAYLQNSYSPNNPQEQGLTLALALSERILAGCGAWRLHGGGFAGTILAFVPHDKKDVYRDKLSAVFGDGCCHFLEVNKHGGGTVL